MYEFWYDVNYGNNVEGGGEFFGSTAQECADYIRERYSDFKDLEIVQILRVESEWE